MMRYRVEVFRQVRIDDIRVPLAQRRMHRPNRIVRRTPRSIAIGTVLEVRFEDRFQHQLRGRLRHAVPNRRDPEWSLAAAWFGNHHPAHRRRPIRLLAQVLSQRREPRFHAGRVDVLETHPVHTGGSARRARQSIGMGEDVLAVHLVVQQIEPVLGLLLRLHVQLPLPPPNAVGSLQAHANLPVLGSFRSTQK